jgi:hypothetical protein
MISQEGMQHRYIMVIGVVDPKVKSVSTIGYLIPDQET